MRVLIRIVLCCAFCLSAVSATPARAVHVSEAFHTEGVFSNITTGPGGDYGGMQIYLTDSDGQFYATVTIAEGVLLPPVLVKVKVQVEQRKIEFSLPGGEGSRKFTGTVSKAGLTLFEEGRKIFLKRTCLY